ncbi:hypothetical protein GGF50DRAFT_90299 [Schizophyllum commune]
MSRLPPTILPADALLQMRSILGSPTAQCTSIEQHSGIVSLFRLERDVILALGSAWGMAASIVLPSFYEKAVTVILVPSADLLPNWTRRLRSMNVPYECFLSGGHARLAGSARVILVTMAVARERHWKAELQRLVGSGIVIARIVLDEAHVALLRSSWPAFCDLHELRAVACPLVLITSTYPPVAERWFRESFGLVHPHILRHPQDQSNVSHVLGEVMTDFQQASRLIMAMVSAVVKKNHDRYLIVVASTHTGMQLSRRLGLEFYHAHTEEGEFASMRPGQASMYERWIQSHRSGIITTNALVLCKYYPHIRAVFWVGTPPTAMEYMDACDCAVETETWQDLQGTPSTTPGRKCVRGALEEYRLGKRGRKCFEVEGVALCHFCAAAPVGTTVHPG